MAETLLSINVNDHTEKKNGLTYLSWAWAWAEVLKVDPAARFEVRTFGADHLPVCFIGDSAMVCVEVVIKGLCRECWLPVMDNRNKAIKNPDAFAINTAIMRCMTKAVSLHGLGLYIYAGEDLPQTDDGADTDLTPVLQASIEKAKARKVGTGVAADVLSTSPPLEANTTAYLDELAEVIKTAFAQQGAGHAYECLAAENLDDTQKVYLWTRLPSNVRNPIKAHSQAIHAATKETA